MIKEIKDITEAGTWDEMRHRLGAFLGAKEAVPSAMLNRAMHDDKFAYYLLTCRNQPQFLKALENDPRNKEFEPAVANEEKSNVQLVAGAAKAMLRWSKSGFTQIEKDVYEQRFAACLRCPHLSEPPDKMVYKLASNDTTDRRVCGACGCVASRKTKLPTEKCPVADPENPAVNRWGQPMEEEVTA